MRVFLLNYIKMKELIYGIVFGILGQIGSFMQFQCSFKYNWMDKYPVLLLLSGIPVSWFYIKSVHYLIEAFKEEMWPGRLIGFGIGVVVFAAMSTLLFRETITLKTVVSLLLACSIVGIQIIWK